MCGIVGVVDFNEKYPISEQILRPMTDKLFHRGPDDSGFYIGTCVGFGFRRLSIIDLEHGQQPFYSQDKTIALVCNGEIYNYKELRQELQQKGYRFSTQCDVEVLIPLYQEYGKDFIRKLNGQFAIALFDRDEQTLILARDHVGIVPLFYTLQDGVLIFASEIKAILAHPLAKRRVNVRGLDQVLTYPGLVSPTTMFEGIHALKPGHFLIMNTRQQSVHEYWDLNYPSNTLEDHPDDYYVERLDELLNKAIRYRLNADVPVGYYLSGGLDSSLIAGIVHNISSSSERHAFSIGFTDHEHDERAYQNLLAQQFNATRHEVIFDWDSVADRLSDAVYYAESPLKETYNTCSLALSEMVRNNNIKVVLTGEGADELFAGYVGYRFDELRANGGQDDAFDVEKIMENEERSKLWGDSNFFYEKNYYEFRETKLAIYSEALRERFSDFNAVDSNLIDKTKLVGRHPIHKRSYIDFKLRLSDHLLADHGDRVAYRNSVEARYPFLDVELIEFAKTIPPRLKLNGLIEKYIVKKIAENYIPFDIANREKFHFVAPGSPALLKQNIEWVEDLLSYNTIQRQGYFDPDTVERIKKMYRRDGFKLNLPYDSDLLIIILTFGVFLEQFDIGGYS
ncbi:MAG: asparagine synthase (glutamine-hydrolyzing) [Gammaproteobacteria bacterium]|nr:asparagine synthase (glutamine-hydrolyzing) [Gammaproteobacteria bacterium]